MKWSVRLVVALGLLGLAAAAPAQTCNANIPASTPTADFTDHGDGTVTHGRTGLMWKRCAEGQTWSGSVCTGTATTATWASALASAVAATTAGHTDWRLPNIKELESIVEDKCYGPAINTSIFPTTSASFFWSASAYAGNSNYAWYVYFNLGYADAYYKSNAYRVRLVRAGQSFGSFDSTDTVALTVGKTGAGTIIGGAINCGSSCTAPMGRGWPVTLTTTPAANLIAWGGACTGTAATCTVTMDSAKSVSASFLNTPLVSGLPASLSFALRNIGSTSSAQMVTLSNTGTATLTLGSIVASGDFGVTDNFAVTHNCGSGLGEGGSCTLNVTFTPSGGGIRYGSVTLTSNAPGSPHTIALSGIGQAGAVALNATALFFPSTNQGGTSLPQTLTLSNPGGGTLYIANIATSGDFVRTTTCGSTLAMGASCSISVRFTPTVVGARSGELTIDSDALTSPHTVVTLSGTGLAAPLVSLNPTALGFAEQRIGTTSAAQAITLSNAGAAELSISSIVGSGDFTVSHNCGTGLGVGGFCDLTVHFKPKAGGSRTGSITINSNAAASPHTVSLSGKGKAAGLTPILMLLLD